MALDKAVDSADLDAGMVLVADAIRSKAGTTEPLAWPDGFRDAVESITGGVATDVTDSIVSVAFSSTNAFMTYNGFDGIRPEDAKFAIFIFQGDHSNAATNQCLFAVLQRLYINSSNLYQGVMMFCRWRNSAYDFQTSSTASYDLIVNAGDTFRMVVVR